MIVLPYGSIRLETELSFGCRSPTVALHASRLGLSLTLTDGVRSLSRVDERSDR